MAYNTHYRREALKAAKDLFYGQAIIAEIRKAKSDDEISRIMAKARLGGR